MILTIEEFEKRCKPYDILYPSNHVVQENALMGETASYLVLLIVCNHFGIVIE